MEIHTSMSPMPAVERAPDGPPKGAVLVMHEAFGLTDHIAGVCQRFADHGWHVLAPALFHREGSPVYNYDDLPSGQASVNKLKTDFVRFDIIDSLQHLSTC